MVKAHSLLYAIYICLIVGVLCGALLYISGLYHQLNIYYNTHEDLYIHNQSLVNYALSHAGQPDGDVPVDEITGIEAQYEMKRHGLLTVLLAKSIFRRDTIGSAHFVGKYTSDKTCIYLPGFGKPLSYSGKVKLIGKKYLPAQYIEPQFITNGETELAATGPVFVSEKILPQNNIATLPEESGAAVTLNSVEKENDSIYFNSFFNPTRHIKVSGQTLSNVIIKGNFVITSPDSLFIKKDVVLEDVIIIAPKIAFEDNFKGNVQAFAKESISLGENTSLIYPSVLCITNSSLNKSLLIIKDNCNVQGSVMLYGNDFLAIDENRIEIGKNSLVLGDIYCAGVLTLFGDVYGSVYTNKFLHKTDTGRYENCLADVEINADKRPEFLIGIPIFNHDSMQYGLLKKIL